ncbi:Predicted oxidoreductase [Arboricoccus pini]|uniref:Predicted oxidoreductase n=1 Tax=Arboricoccus pini TaxID=1963835 RepID=A0A212RJG4_9PROT|nr:aldo/keto reductase [Arboricoccus pini]SNB72560.1 Predicted oxidoreductase [Arboricoccus pini]
MSVERLTLAPGYTISRVIRGGWQLAGGHGAIDADAVLGDLMAAFDAGITTFDCADIYTGVEELYGRFRQRLAKERGTAALARLKIHTKMVPDLALLERITEDDVRLLIGQSLKRLGMQRLDLVQFHWWDYGVARDMEVMGWLEQLRREGLIDRLGATNFGTAHTYRMLKAGIPLFSMQTQYSVLDARPENGLVALAAKEGVHLFCYGTVAGGFLAESWLGRAEPKEPLENRSLTKYKLIIDDFGGWELFQLLLSTLQRIGQRHGVDIATVASRYILDRPGVAGVIVGARNRAHLQANVALGELKLSAADQAEIAAVLARRKGPVGDTYALERDREGPHGRIMKYNLNTSAAQKRP